MTIKGPFFGEARWIWCKYNRNKVERRVNALYRRSYFRRVFNVPEDGDTYLTVYVSADSQYILYLNGEMVSRGPAKGDIKHQFYEEVHLDSFLHPGKNVLAAMVVSYSPVWASYGGDGAPCSIMTATSAFVLDGTLMRKGSQEEIERIYTDRRWKAMPDSAYQEIIDLTNSNITGMCEELDGIDYPWGWTNIDYDDSNWEYAADLGIAVRPETDNIDHNLPYCLIPRMIPPLEETLESFVDVYQANGVECSNVLKLIADEGSLTIPPGTSISFVVDAGKLTTGYPMISLHGGEGSSIKLTYSESWYINGKKVPIHIPQNGHIVGYYDRYICASGKQYYEPFHWRTFRYILVEIETGQQELVINRFSYRFTGYPYKELASFESSDNQYTKIWDMAWRTVKLCSHETYEDCPYYEQMQYAGDTQTVILYSGYVSGDWRLARQAIKLFDWSRGQDGLVQSRYPSRVPQFIPSWSLLWVLMVRDYWWHSGDEETTRSCLDGIKANLEWFSRFQNADGMLEDLPYWKIVDWVEEWQGGCPPGAQGGISSIINLQYSTALQAAADLFEHFRFPEEAAVYRRRASRINAYVNRYCWSENGGMYYDRPRGPEASELGNAWAILSEAASPERMKKVAQRILSGDSLAKATLYGRFYVFRAMRRADEYKKAEKLFDWWHSIAQTDLTTLPEEPRLTRSYCHAWSATPLYEFLAEILGISLQHQASVRFLSSLKCLICYGQKEVFLRLMETFP